MEFSIRSQAECVELSRVLIAGLDGYATLSWGLQEDLLGRGRDSRDGLKLCLECAD